MGYMSQIQAEMQQFVKKNSKKEATVTKSTEDKL